MLILFLIVLVSNLTLGMIVYLKSSRSRVAKIFTAFVLFLSLWMSCNYLQNEFWLVPMNNLLLRMDFATAPIFVYLFFLFCLNFQKTHLVSTRLREFLLFLPGLSLAILSFSNLIITQIDFYQGSIRFETSYLFPLYAGYLFTYIGGGCLDLFFKYRFSRGTEKLQIFYILAGFILYASLALPANLFLQSIIPVDIFRIANYSLLFLITFTGHSILKYRFMDIRLVVRKTTVFSLSVIIVIIFAFGLWLLLHSYITNSLAYLMLILVPSLIIFLPLHRLGEKLANRYLFSELYESEETLRNISGKIVNLMSVEEIASLIINIGMDVFKTEKTGLLLKKGEIYKPYKPINLTSEHTFLPKNGGFLEQDMQCLTGPVTQGEINLRLRDLPFGEEQSKLSLLRDKMRELGIELCLPLRKQKEKIGILLLGEKIDNRAYTRQDLLLLETLAGQFTTALENAKLYEHTKKALTRMRELHRIFININSTFDTSQIFQLAVENSLNLTSSQRSTLFLLEEKNKLLNEIAHKSIPSFPYRIPSRALSWKAIREKKPVIAKNATRKLRITTSQNLEKTWAMTIAIPMMGRNRILGTIVVSKISSDSFPEEDIHILSLLADQVAITLEKLQLLNELKQAHSNLQRWSDQLEERVKQKTQEVRRIHERLLETEKLAGIGQLAAGIAHEIRNPLGIIATSTYYLSEILPKDQKEVKKHLEILDSEVNRCQTIITNLLEFSRNSDQDRQWVDVNKLLEMTLSLINKDLVTKDILLIKRLNKVPPILANPEKMKQVFLNLILNATQAMPNGGKLAIETSMASKKTLKIIVSDTGEGISPEDLGQIFNPFFTTKSPGEGIGLGLSLVHSIIKSHQGSIAVRSKKDTGTTFTIKLPVSRCSA